MGYNKQQHREAIRERARCALSDLYHNATPNFPTCKTDDESRQFWDWFQDAAEYEIEYLQDGGAYGRSVPKMPQASQRARSYAERRYMRQRADGRADCGVLTGWRVMELAAGNDRVAALIAKYPDARRGNALWERIGEYGKLYTWGRGGRTLAPDGLIRQHGGSGFSIREDYADDIPIGSAVDLIRIVESFNRCVSDWCRDVPEMWAEEQKDRAAEREAEETERRECEARDIMTEESHA